MTIKLRRKHKKEPKEEYFEIFPGNSGNDIRIIDVDKDLRQVILTVHEPRRTFSFVEFDREKMKNVTRTRTTQDWKRSYLVGMDQTHLFIAELPKGASTVKVAHEVLKPSAVKGKKGTRRQGEWFFVPATADEQLLIDGSASSIQRRAKIPGNTQNFHVAEQLIVMKDGEKEKMFAIGKVTHPEHRAISLKRWCAVLKNTERPNADRVGWID